MRKIIAIVIAAGVLFAVGAFAATITNVSGEDIASGSDDIAACADDVEVDWDIGEYSTSDEDWPVTGVTLAIDTIDSPDTSCDGAEVEIVVLNDDDGLTVLDTVSGTLAGGTFGDTLTGVLVADVTRVDVAIEGLGLSVPSPSL